MVKHWSVVIGVVALLAVGCSSAESKKQKFYADANAAFDNKHYPEAILGYRNAIKIDPRFGDARYKLAQALNATGDIANAAREYVNAADLLPDNVDAHLNAARYLPPAR